MSKKYVNEIYRAIIQPLEELESKKILSTNGHHLAQKLTKLISIELLPDNQKKIYEALSEEPQSAREIADKVNMSTKLVSAYLGTMEKDTLLVHSKTTKNKRKIYRITY